MANEQTDLKIKTPHSKQPVKRISIAIRKGRKTKFLKGKPSKDRENNFLIVVGKNHKKLDPKFGTVYFASNDKEAEEIYSFISNNIDVCYTEPDLIDFAWSLDLLSDDQLIENNLYIDIEK